jgi:TolB-like protein
VEGISARSENADIATIQLRLIGPLRALTSDNTDILPSLRKARAILVVLALADGQTATRRWLAGLLWSRNDPAQGLARLRDTLSTLRLGLRDSMGDTDLVQVTPDRVTLRPGAVKVDLDAANFSADASCLAKGEVASDLDGIDPALDEWLLVLRGRYRSKREEAAPPQSRAKSAIKRGVVIGVTALHAMGGDSELAFAVAEELATSLGRIRGVSVVSRVSSPTTGVNETGLDFRVEGSMQRLGERVRVAVRLVEMPSGVVCWSSHFDYEHDDVFHIQQDVAALVAAGLEPELPTISGERMRRTGNVDEGAYVLLLRAISLIHLLDRRSFNEAGALLSRVIELESDYSSAYSWLALWHVFLVGQGWARDARASITRAGEVAEHAVMLDPNDARGLTIAGHVRAFLHRRLDEALPLHERALAINPSLPLAWHLSGVAQAYKGNLDEARRRIEHCRRLAPRDPHSFFADGAAIIVELLSRQHESAAEIGRKVTQLHPRFSAAYKPYLAALGHLGEEREAGLVHRRLLQLEPDFSLKSFRLSAPFARREHLEHYVSGLTLAGVV